MPVNRQKSSRARALNKMPIEDKQKIIDEINGQLRRTTKKN
jgi:molybdate-binding protein